MRSFTRVLGIILLVAWMGFIFYMSAQPASASSQISGGVIEIIAEKFYPQFETLSEVEKAEIVSSFQFTVRKSAHIGGFALLGVFAFLTFISYTKLRFFTRVFFASAVSILYAASDEFHQRFVAGRSCELRDFLLDTAGVITAVLLCTAFVKIIPPLRRKTAFAGLTKKSLVNQNYELYIKLDNAVADNKRLENLVANHERIIEKLRSSLYDKTTHIMQIEAKSGEDKKESNKKIKLSPEMEYAAKIIGNVVELSAKVCNKITCDKCENEKDLINLALGRNEVLKAHIVKILGLEISFEEKQALMLKEKQLACDYLNSIIAQMC